MSLTPGPLGATGDEVVCPGVEGDNLAAAALRAFRARTGLGGRRRAADDRQADPGRRGHGRRQRRRGRRAAPRGARRGHRRRRAAARHRRGPRRRRARAGAPRAGAGHRRRGPARAARRRRRAYGVAILPSHARLSTADVFREADRLGLARDAAGLAERLAAVRAAAADLPGELLVNDLQPAALSLCPAIADALESVRAAGARHALVCGSGPTVAGLFDDPTGARAAVAMLADRDPRPVAVTPWGARA